MTKAIPVVDGMPSKSSLPPTHVKRKMRSPYACDTLRFVNRKELKKYFAKFGKQGGKSRAKKLTPEQRTESARKAAQARWKKRESA